MTRYRFDFVWGRSAAAVALTVSTLVLGACSSSTAPGNMPTSAVINIDGTTPNPLTLIVSTDFYEQVNLSTGEYTPILVTSDTVPLTPPYNRTVDISALGNIYVEVYQPEVATASVHMKVDLNNGQGYDQSATMSDKAQLIYYFVFRNYSH